MTEPSQLTKLLDEAPGAPAAIEPPRLASAFATKLCKDLYSCMELRVFTVCIRRRRKIFLRIHQLPKPLRGCGSGEKRIDLPNPFRREELSDFLKQYIGHFESFTEVVASTQLPKYESTWETYLNPTPSYDLMEDS